METFKLVSFSILFIFISLVPFWAWNIAEDTKVLHCRICHAVVVILKKIASLVKNNLLQVGILLI